jgi:hypothetical protein
MFRATYDRFRDHPILRVSDVVTADPKGEKRSDESCSWHSRKYSQTWELVTRSSDTGTTVLSPPVHYRLLMATDGCDVWQRYSILKALAHRFHDSLPSLVFKNYNASPAVRYFEVGRLCYRTA